jgi:hypothetical protein
MEIRVLNVLPRRTLSGQQVIDLRGCERRSVAMLVVRAGMRLLAANERPAS